MFFSLLVSLHSLLRNNFITRLSKLLAKFVPNCLTLCLRFVSLTLLLSTLASWVHTRTCDCVRYSTVAAVGTFLRPSHRRLFAASMQVLRLCEFFASTYTLLRMGMCVCAYTVVYALKSFILYSVIILQRRKGLQVVGNMIRVLLAYRVNQSDDIRKKACHTAN